MLLAASTPLYYRLLGGLLEAFGDPDDIDVNKVEDTTIKGNLVAVRIECPSKPGFKTVTKKLPPTMQV